MSENGLGRRAVHLARRLVPLAVALGILLAVATLAGFAGGLWWVIDLLAALRVQYAFGFLLLGLVSALAGVRLIAVACLVGLLVNASFVAPLYLGAPAPPKEDGGVLRIMFLNTEIRAADPDQLIDDLRTAHHDLVFLSAVTDRWAEALEEAAIPYSVAQARPRGTSVELLLLARHGVPVETTVQDFGPGGRSKAIEARVLLDGTTVRVLAMHPVSPVTPARAATHADQLDAMALWARLQSDPVVVIGDLNATPWSRSFRRLLEAGDLLNSQAGFGLQASWPVGLGFLGIPIDHALHSEELTTVERSLGPGYGSAHRSIHVGVVLAQPG